MTCRKRRMRFSCAVAPRAARPQLAFGWIGLARAAVSHRAPPSHAIHTMSVETIVNATVAGPVLA